MKEVELLAPAGSYEALVAAIQNGADAIYLGGNEFSARAFATNFNREELQKAVKYSHLRGVKIYVTVNTLYEDKQFEELQNYLIFLQSINVDALIIQDIGLLKLVKEYFPDFEIHMSTQTSVYNLLGVKYFEKLGVKRVVLARENTINEINNICHNTLLDIEVFVHGALCMSYSGQCLMSSMIAKRSGNKGACGQPCRLPYKLQKDNVNLDKQPSYLLSPRDLCTIENVGELIEAGIMSFKIEGRMKRPEYVAIVIKQYREAIDSYLNSKKLTNVDTKIKDMKKMFNRGFTKGFIFNDKEFMAKDYPGNRGIVVGTVVNYDKKHKTVQIKLSDDLKQGDRINFKDLDFTRTVTKLFLNGRLINKANSNDIVEIELNSPVKINETVFKVIDSQLIEEANNSYSNENIRNNISMVFSGQLNQLASLNIKYNEYSITVYSKNTVALASKTPLSMERIRTQLSKLGNTVFCSNDIKVNFDDSGYLNIKELNEMRRIAIDKLSEEITKNTNSEIEIPEVNYQHLTKNIKGINVRTYTLEQLNSLINEDVNEYYFPLNENIHQAIQLANKYNKSIVPFTGFLNNSDDLIKFKNSDDYQLINKILVGDYGALELFKDKDCILDTNFNIYNSNALSFFEKNDVVLSLELSKNNINYFNNVKQKIILTVYGKTINMNLKHCLISDHYFGYKKEHCNLCKQGNYNLIDRKGECFKIITDNNCNNYIFNNHCLYLDQLNNLDVDYILLSFSDEDSNTVKNVYRDFKNIINVDAKSSYKSTLKTTNSYYFD